MSRLETANRVARGSQTPLEEDAQRKTVRGNWFDEVEGAFSTARATCTTNNTNFLGGNGAEDGEGGERRRGVVEKGAAGGGSRRRGRQEARQEHVKGDLKGKRRRWPLKKRRKERRRRRRRKEDGEPVAASIRQLGAQLQPGAVTSDRGFTENRRDFRAITVVSRRHQFSSVI